MSGPVWSGYSEEHTSYYPPSIQHLGISATSGSLDRLLDTRGGEVLTLTGNNLGPTLSYLTHVMYGDDTQTYYATECILAVPHRQIKCNTSAGVGRDYKLNVTVKDQVLRCRTPPHVHKRARTHSPVHTHTP